jgi:hypothetical protein
MRQRATIIALTTLLLATDMKASVADALPNDLERQFTETVRPFLSSFCVTCHGGDKPKAQLDLSSYKTMASAVHDHGHWEIILERLVSEDMPPEKAKEHPTSQARRDVIQWIQAMRQQEARRNAGDPGPALARRLSNAEYDYTIRDLTGVDIKPTREFPVDPANEAGFDNSAESLAMSPALLKKYLDAARTVSEFLILKPQGLAFAPHPVVAETDRDKYCVRRIIEFYQRQATNHADYFMAAWRFRHRSALGKPASRLADVAAENKISAKYLATIWSALIDDQIEIGPLAALRAIWRELPVPDANNPDAVRGGCERMRDFVTRLRAQLVPEVKNLTAPRVHNGSQPMVLWKNRQYAANRMRYAGPVFDFQPDEFALGSTVAAQALASPSEEKARKTYEAEFQRFCAIFPDTFYVSERARVYLDPEKEKKLGGRLLSAGFHSMTGYFRDDGPLYHLILDEPGQRELDSLWRDFNFMSSVPIRMHTSFIWFERSDSSFMMSPEFAFARAEDKDCTSEQKIKQLAEVYLDKARKNGASEIAQQAIQDHFTDVNVNVRRVEKDRAASEPTHLKALLTFAERAYRRPLSAAERDDLLAFYRAIREQGGLDHEDAIRDTIVRVLMSPSFCFRLDLADASVEIRPASSKAAPAGQPPQPENFSDGNHTHKVRPLSDYALASRLSYFLWSSMPDEELLKHAAAGDLHRPEVLMAQVRRMVQDDRVHGLATEFAGNWADFRRFEEHNAVDRERFPSFNNELRQAMFEEPIRFFLNVVKENGSVLDFLYGDYTFVNGALARHYGMPEAQGEADAWVRVNEASRYERGGLLPMAVFLTKNAPGLRTSPVKRGYWVVRRLLGERIPPPPPTVPELPSDEGKLGDLTLRELLARHRQDKSCAGCHERFDAMGLVFEGYGPVGERRSKDLGGRPVEIAASFPGGSEGAGVAGLRKYLREHREQDFVDNLCRKLLAYALGRNVMLSDDLTISQMKAKLKSNGHRFDSLLETIVTSPQFLNKREQENLAQN